MINEEGYVDDDMRGAGVDEDRLETDLAARLERARVIRLVREALAVKPGPYMDRRKVKAVERLLKELE